MATVKHKFISAKADGANTSEVRPTNWNADHDFKTVGASVYLGQNASGAGLVKELPIEAEGSDDYTIYTKAAVDAAIAAAFAAYKPFVTGDLFMSIATSRPGWVLCNGTELFLGNGPSNHDLFILLWGINGGTWPVTPSRGASAEADWLASKVLRVPDTRGCVFAMVDAGANVNSLVNLLAVKVGVEKVYLDTTNIPTHTHTLYDPANMLIRGNLGGTGSGSPVYFDDVSNKQTGATGGDPAAVPPYANPVPVNVTQPTMGVNIFIKL